MKELEKRKPRSYKATESYYNKARNRATKDHTNLASILETVVELYADGANHIKFFGSLIATQLPKSKLKSSNKK